MHKKEINIIFGMTHCKSTTKEHVCQIVKTHQGSNDSALFMFFIFKMQLSVNK